MDNSPFFMDRFAEVGEGTEIRSPHLSIFTNPENIHIGRACKIDGLVKIEGGGGVWIDDNVHICSMAVINTGGGRVWLEAGAGISAGVIISAGMPDLSYLHISAADAPEHQHPLRLETRIGRNSVLFPGARVLPGVTIGRGCIVGAGAVVTKDIPDWEHWQGVPARFKSRRGPLK